LVVPDVLCRLALGEEQQVGGDRGVGLKHGVGQAHDGVQIAVFQQFLADTLFDAIAGQGTIRQDNGGAATVLEQMDHQDQEQVRRFLGAVGLREVVLVIVGNHTTKGRIGDDHVYPIFARVFAQGPLQRVTKLNAGGD